MRRLAAIVTSLALVSLPAEAGRPVAGTGSVAGKGRDVVNVARTQGGVEAERLAARAALADRLNRLATWCNDKELFIERDRIWRKVLEIAPDDATARKGLRYARNVDGSWKEPPPRDLKNIGKKFLEELPKRESEAFAPYGDTLLALAKAPERSAPEREGLLAEIRTIAPDHAGLHELLGNVKLGDTWVLPETATAKTRRAELRALVKKLVEFGAPVQPDVASDQEKALGVPWKSVVQGENVRVLSTGPEDEALALAKSCEGAGELLLFALGTPVRYPGAYTLYVVAGDGEKEVFLKNLPGIKDDEIERLTGLEGTGIPRSSNVALFGKDPLRRRDAAVRHTIANMLALTLGITDKTAWAWEGIGQYLTRELVGTRLTWFVSENADPAAANLRGKLMTPESNWIQEAFTLLSTGTATPLEELMLRDLDRLDVAGALTGYALVAYLLEGQPTVALDFVTRCAKAEETPATITKETVQMTPAELQERLVRWLSERR